LFCFSSREIPQRPIDDDDQESGKGNSIPQSPVYDNENSYEKKTKKYLFSKSVVFSSVRLVIFFTMFNYLFAEI